MAATKYGGIAQLGERLNGIQEVSGSIPLISTKKVPRSSDFGTFSFYMHAFCSAFTYCVLAHSHSEQISEQNEASL